MSSILSANKNDESVTQLPLPVLHSSKHHFPDPGKWLVRILRENGVAMHKAPITSEGSSAEWERIRRRVLADDPLCHWCRTEPATQVDHVVPRVRGGDERPENLVPSCEPCNLARGGLPATQPSRAW